MVSPFDENRSGATGQGVRGAEAQLARARLGNPEIDESNHNLYRAGRLVPAGRYQRIDTAAGRTIVHDDAGHLPASLDGRVALYRRLAPAISLGNGRRAAEMAESSRLLLSA